MRALRAQVRRLAPTPLSTLVLGETGTGKERVARALHAGSGRRGPWVVLCCATLPAALAESAILGHAKGAFTGASHDRPGAFEQAHGGTLLLDEVGELPLALQPKLLRALQEREVTRVGESRPRAVDVRVVAATHRDLGEDVARGRFRLDLHQRLAQAVLHLPPLRERPGDIAALATHFVAEVAAARARPLRLTAEALAALHGARWPGNVRGLQNAVQRGAYLCAQPPSITVADLALPPPPRSSPAPTSTPGWQTLPLKDAAARNDAAFRRAFVQRCLADSGGNLTLTAQRLGYSRKGLRALLQRLGLSREGANAEPRTNANKGRVHHR